MATGPALSDLRRLTNPQRVAVGVLVILTAAVGIGLGTVAPAEQTAEPPPVVAESACTTVQIFTGRPGSPYNQFARVLRGRLEARRPQWDVEIVETNGSTENIYDLEMPDNRECSLALAQLNTTVDASEGVNQFDPNRGGHAVEGLRTIAPAHHDLLHVIVRDPGYRLDDVNITTLGDLCGRAIAPGPANSGTRQISDVLLRVGLPEDCVQQVDDSTIDEALRRLSAGTVDAVFWAGGAGTRQIVNAIQGGAKLQLLDLEPYREGVAEDWDQFYRLRGRFFPGTVFAAGRAGPNDYPGLTETRTIAIPNGVLAHQDADAGLVQQVAVELFSGRADYETALWGQNKGQRTIPDALSIYESPMFCYIPLHPAAQAYYVGLFGRVPSCTET